MTNCLDDCVKNIHEFRSIQGSAAGCEKKQKAVVILDQLMLFSISLVHCFAASIVVTFSQKNAFELPALSSQDLAQEFESKKGSKALQSGTVLIHNFFWSLFHFSFSTFVDVGSGRGIGLFCCWARHLLFSSAEKPMTFIGSELVHEKCQQSRLLFLVCLAIEAKCSNVAKSKIVIVPSGTFRCKTRSGSTLPNI